ncbi:ORF3 [Simian adenovirus 16]|uniref:ORF3 n=1 Tax=Simian adenovirus 16 TaxID=1715778 RepID=A0A0M3TH15_9ADEN|nr:ORF3 [Simian adenovirus 16]ALE30416.1 ORF3 [Simian adenovirus 16]
MKVCLRMQVEGALTDLFQMHGLDLQTCCVNILREWKNENYMGMVQSCSLMIDENEDHGFALLLFTELRVEALLEAIVDHLDNRMCFDLAVMYHQHSGGDRCHLRDLHFEVLQDRLE